MVDVRAIRNAKMVKKKILSHFDEQNIQKMFVINKRKFCTDWKRIRSIFSSINLKNIVSIKNMAFLSVWPRLFVRDWMQLKMLHGIDGKITQRYKTLPSKGRNRKSPLSRIVLFCCIFFSLVFLFCSNRNYEHIYSVVMHFNIHTISGR